MAAIIVRGITIEEFREECGDYARYLDGTGDVDEVVQCKDCVYYEKGRCLRWDDGTSMFFDDFCSHGVLKEDEHDKG